MKKLFITLSFLIINFLTFSQKPKIAYVYEGYILENLNETKALQAEVASKKLNLENKLEQKATLYREELASYQNLMKDIRDISADSLNAKLKKVQGLKKDIDDFQANAETELQQLIQQKFIAIREHINRTIKLVAAENGYDFVFRRDPDMNNNESNTVMLYAADNDSQNNISDAVLKKMGSTPPKK